MMLELAKIAKNLQRTIMQPRVENNLHLINFRFLSMCLVCFFTVDFQVLLTRDFSSIFILWIVDFQFHFTVMQHDIMNRERREKELTSLALKFHDRFFLKMRHLKWKTFGSFEGRVEKIS